MAEERYQQRNDWYQRLNDWRDQSARPWIQGSSGKSAQSITDGLYELALSVPADCPECLEDLLLHVPSLVHSGAMTNATTLVAIRRAKVHALKHRHKRELERQLQVIQDEFEVQIGRINRGIGLPTSDVRLPTSDVRLPTSDVGGPSFVVAKPDPVDDMDRFLIEQSRPSIFSLFACLEFERVLD